MYSYFRDRTLVVGGRSILKIIFNFNNLLPVSLIIIIALYIAFILSPSKTLGTGLFLSDFEWEKAIEVMAKPTSKNTFQKNTLLYRFYAQEGLLRSEGDKKMEQIAQHVYLMQAYSMPGTLSENLFGKGYMKDTIISPIKNTAMNDNTVGVFLLSEFGFFGFLGCMMALLVFIKINQYNGVFRRRLSEIDDLWPICTLLISGTFIYYFIYMTGVNYNVLPFTGKNIYFWGLNSKSDVLEGMFLFGILFFSQLAAHKEK